MTSADWDRLPRLVGCIAGRGEMEVEGKTRPFLTVDAGHAIYRVWFNAGLSDVFADGVVGDYVDIVPLPKIPIKGGRTFRPFKVALFNLAEGEKLSDVVAGNPPASITPILEPVPPLTGTEAPFVASDDDVPF
jgi:hypothetical protein